MDIIGNIEIGRKSETADGREHLGTGTILAILRHAGKDPLLRLLLKISQMAPDKNIAQSLKTQEGFRQDHRLFSVGEGASYALPLQK